MRFKKPFLITIAVIGTAMLLYGGYAGVKELFKKEPIEQKPIEDPHYPFVSESNSRARGVGTIPPTTAKSDSVIVFIKPDQKAYLFQLEQQINQLKSEQQKAILLLLGEPVRENSITFQDGVSPKIKALKAK